MTSQTICQIIALLGLFISAGGGFGSYYFGKMEEREKAQKSDIAQRALTSQIAKFEEKQNARTELILRALNVKPDVWTSVEINTVPPGVTEFLLLLFQSTKGNISGKVRVKGSDRVASFSTTVNDHLPVAVANLWMPEQKQYQVPTVIEFTITDKTFSDAGVSILTQGWIDSLGREPQ